jgi:hypothetical protein
MKNPLHKAGKAMCTAALALCVCCLVFFFSTGAAAAEASSQSAQAANSSSSYVQTEQGDAQDASVTAEQAPLLVLAGVILLVVPLLALVFTALWVVKLCKKFRE